MRLVIHTDVTRQLPVSSSDGLSSLARACPRGFRAVTSARGRLDTSARDRRDDTILDGVNATWSRLCIKAMGLQTKAEQGLRRMWCLC
jgi:hypothetical protein